LCGLEGDGSRLTLTPPAKVPLPGRAALIAAGGRRTLCLTEGGSMVEFPNSVGRAFLKYLPSQHESKSLTLTQQNPVT